MIHFSRLSPKARLAALLVAVLAVVAAAVLVLRKPGDANGDKEATATQRPALTVTTARPSSALVPMTLDANGNVAAWQEASIGSELGGQRLAEVRVNVGDVVRKGEVLAVFAPETVKAEVAQAKAALLEARAASGEAAANAARARSLSASGALSAQQIAQYTTLEATAGARLEAAKAALEAQELRLRHTSVVAPDDGVISARSATVGSVVGVGTELFRMIRKGRLEWRAEVTASDLTRIRRGTGAVVRSAAGSELRGRVRMIAPTIDPQTRSALVYVDLPPAAGMDAPFRAGMFASGRFELGQSRALTVPQQAVVVRDGFSYVFRLGADQRVSQLKVTAGRRTGDRIEIVSGLAPDAEVVVAGAGFLNDGDLVRNVPAQAARAGTR